MKRVVFYVLCIFYISLILCACTSDPNKTALKELDRRKIPFTEQMFLEKAYEGDIGAIKQFIIAGINKEARTAEDGYTALMIAAYAGHAEIVRILLDNGLNVNAFDNTGVTALMRAAVAGHTDCAKVLLEKGADNYLSCICRQRRKISSIEIFWGVATAEVFWGVGSARGVGACCFFAFSRRSFSTREAASKIFCGLGAFCVISH